MSEGERRIERKHDPPSVTGHERRECATRPERGVGGPANERAGRSGGVKPPDLV